MSRENAARRNRALRKIRQCRKLPIEIKATIELLLDFLGQKTDYAIAWPSAATLASRLNRSVRTIRWHLKAIKRTGIFGFQHMSPTQATEFIETRCGFKPKFERCSHQAPTIFVVNESHWLWDGSTKVAPENDEQLAAIVQKVLSARKRRRELESGSLASRSDSKPMQICSENRSAYDLHAIRASLLRYLESNAEQHPTLQEDQAGHVVSDTSHDVADDMTRSVADNTQVGEEQKELQAARSFRLFPGPIPTLPVLEATQLDVEDSSLAVAKATARVELRSRDEADKSSSSLPLRSIPFRFRKKQGGMEQKFCEEEEDSFEVEAELLLEDFLVFESDDDEPRDEAASLCF